MSRDRASEPELMLRSALPGLGIKVSDRLINQLDSYRTQLQKWGRIHNLTANRSDRDIVVQHFLDSFLYLQGFPEHGPLDVADVGTGAGFPGLPVALVRPLDRFTLYEPRTKKASFVRHMIRILDLHNVHLVQERIEAVAAAQGPYDVIMTRALFDPSALVQASRRLIKPGGRWLLSLGPSHQMREIPPGLEAEKKRMTLPVANVDRWLIILITKGVPRGTS